MFLEDFIPASDILEDPDLMDRVEDPYVIVIQNTGLYKAGSHRKNMLAAMTLMYDRGWETVNISFDFHVGLVALLKNPRAKNKNQPETEG
jgi:hypothetical protein